MLSGLVKSQAFSVSWTPISMPRLRRSLTIEEFDGTDIRRADTGSLGVRCRGGAQFRCRGILRMSGKRQ